MRLTRENGLVGHAKATIRSADAVSEFKRQPLRAHHHEDWDQDKRRVERAVQNVRGNFWAGETFTDLADALGPGRDLVPGEGRDVGARHHREAARRNECSPN